MKLYSALAASAVMATLFFGGCAARHAKADNLTAGLHSGAVSAIQGMQQGTARALESRRGVTVKPLQEAAERKPFDEWMGEDECKANGYRWVTPGGVFGGASLSHCEPN